MIQRLTSYFWLVVMTWVVITLLLNFVVPNNWFFNYKNLHAGDVCIDDRGNGVQSITGTRWSLFTTPAEGVDQIIYVPSGRPVDRLEWSGRYLAGETTTAWQEDIHLAVGAYYWHVSTLKIDILYVFPVYIEPFNSNIFTVYECGV